MAAALPLVTESALQRLSRLTKFYFRQTSVGCKVSNYTVFSEDEGDVLFNLYEIDTCLRHALVRPFQFNGVDNAGRTLFTFARHAAKSFLKNYVNLFMDDALISVIRLTCTFSKPILTINDSLDNPVFRLKGKSLRFFQLQTNDKIAIGAVQKKYRGSTKEKSAIKDDYIISVPVDLAVHFKIAVIVACVFIDFTFFECK